jgi:hypothetical protein
MLKLVLLLTGLLLLSIGLHDLYRLSGARQQSVVTCEQFVRQRPQSAWLRVTGCEIDYVGAGFRESGGRVDELVFPVRPAGHPRTEPAALVAATRDQGALAIAQGTIGGGREPDQEQFLVMMLKIVTALRASREIEGVARTGVLERLQARRLLSGLSAPVTPDAVLVDLHARPRVLVPAVLTGAGALAIVIAAVLSLRRRVARSARATPSRAEPAMPAPQAAGAAGAAPAHSLGAASPPRRLRVLLLALPADADAGTIEHAPPLGDLDDVRATIAQYVPGMHFDAQNRGTVGDREYVIAFDLGRENVVHTAIVDARGARAVTELRRLLSETGWRAYAPKAGVFMDADRLHEV